MHEISTYRMHIHEHALVRLQKKYHLTGINNSSCICSGSNGGGRRKTGKLITSMHAHVQTHALNLQIALRHQNGKLEKKNPKQNINVWCTLNFKIQMECVRADKRLDGQSQLNDKTMETKSKQNRT